MNMEEIKEELRWWFTGWGLKEIGALFYIGACMFIGVVSMYIILG